MLKKIKQLLIGTAIVTALGIVLSLKDFSGICIAIWLLSSIQAIYFFKNYKHEEYEMFKKVDPKLIRLVVGGAPTGIASLAITEPFFSTLLSLLTLIIAGMITITIIDTRVRQFSGLFCRQFKSPT